MALFPRGPRRPSRNEGAPVRAPRDWEVTRQRSLALPKLVEPLEGASSRGFSVLDLGPASPSNLEFFLGRGARLTVADFTPSRSEALSDLLRGDPGARFDLVLAWDFLNYLQRDKLSALLRSLEPYFRPGTTIHALIATAREMSAAPRRYRIEDAATLVCEGSKDRVVPSPRYVEQDLVKCMPGLVVEHRFQLRNGMVEYLFSYRTQLRVAFSAATAPTAEAPRSRSGSGIGLRPAPSR